MNWDNISIHPAIQQHPILQRLHRHDEMNKTPLIFKQRCSAECIKYEHSCKNFGWHGRHYPNPSPVEDYLEIHIVLTSNISDRANRSRR